MTQIAVSPSQDDVFKAVRSFLLSVLPADTPVVQGQQNRVSQPRKTDFVVMWPIRQSRLATNIDDYQDAAFVAAVASGVMTVTAVTLGPVVVGRTLFGENVPVGVVITSQTSGTPGGVGVYALSAEDLDVASEPMAAGGRMVTQKTAITLQIDLHGDDLATASDNGQVITTLFRDAYAVDVLAQTSPAIVPLYAGDPRQIPFIDGEQQVEARWSIDLDLQADVALGLPQQFADELAVDVVSVDAEFPPSS